MTYFLRKEDLPVKVVLPLWKYAVTELKFVLNRAVSIVMRHAVRDVLIQEISQRLKSEVRG